MMLYSKHSKHLVAVDCIIFGYDILEKEIKLLLVKEALILQKENGRWQEDLLNRMKASMLLPTGFSAILQD